MVRSQRRGKQQSESLFLASPRGTASLQELLQELAFVLLARGMTPKGFGELSRSAFVRAAAARSKLRNGRVNHSRVAAQTGLTRAYVKRLLSNDAYDASPSAGQTAVERVIDGWCNDRHFSRGSDNPKPLPISGSSSAFTSLARKYAGDVPYRAVLNELERIGAVVIDGERAYLRTSTQLRRRYDLGFLRPVVPALIDGLRIASADSKVDSSASIYRLLLPIATELDLAFVRDRCTSTAKAMLDGLSNSLGTVKKSAKPRSSDRTFAVTILLAENRIKKVQREPLSAKRRARHGY